jgi:hypothetical protein
MRKALLTYEGSAKPRAIFRQLLNMHAAQSKMIVSLSVKLRLANSSHRNETFDERKLRTTPDGPRPWQQH